MLQYLKQNFSRKVSEDRDYIAAADGIRFFATIHVICGHILVYTGVNTKKLLPQPILDNIYYLFANPGLGLEIFFVLSGFLLMLPFAQWHLYKQHKPNITMYFVRRLIRLELPYLIALTVSTLALVFIIKKYDFSYMLPRYIASFFYTNTLIYDIHPEPLPIAWSLETEVQFYIIVPLLAYIFKLHKMARRILLVTLIISIPIVIKQYSFHSSILFIHFFQYFFAGILCADFYLDKDFLTNKISANIWVALSFMLVFIAIPMLKVAGYLQFDYLLPLVIAFFIYCVLKKDGLKTIFHNAYLRIIGCMCYSIYLWHYMIISALGRYTVKINVGNYFMPNYMVQLLLLTPVILIVAGLYFKYVERPCMYSNLSKKWAKALQQKN
jgi:peptidoglycan/LPS O-acetylase OafA/YrhL